MSTRVANAKPVLPRIIEERTFSIAVNAASAERRKWAHSCITCVAAGVGATARLPLGARADAAWYSVAIVQSSLVRCDFYNGIWACAFA
jgi:hypothetical protein